MRKDREDAPSPLQMIAAEELIIMVNLGKETKVVVLNHQAPVTMGTLRIPMLSLILLFVRR
jgi:hypothetical protein